MAGDGEYPTVVLGRFAGLRHLAAGSSIVITCSAANVVSGSKISLCYDTDTTFNGNEKWIEVDGLAAANGTITYTWNTSSSMAAGTYYLAGYMYDGSSTFTKSHLTTDDHHHGRRFLHRQSFSVTSPASGTYAAGSSIVITCSAANVVSGSKISLCYDTDTTFNGNEKWIEVDGLAAANGTITYTWNTSSSMAAGNYYLAGYMYDGSSTFTKSHLTTPITITGDPAGQSFVLTEPTVTSITAGPAGHDLVDGRQRRVRQQDQSLLRHRRRVQRQ